MMGMYKLFYIVLTGEIFLIRWYLSSTWNKLHVHPGEEDSKQRG